MTKNRIAKIAALTVGMTFALGAVATPAGAVTIAELQTQINALMAQLATLQGGSTVTVTFTQNLTVGSRGADVTALQNWLISKGFSIPAGATGYFGTQTKAAVAAWQRSANVSPAVGFFGPISRGVVNGMGGTVVVGGGTTCPAGYTCTPTGGVISGTITTPGVEGTLTATKAASPSSGAKLYEGSSKVAVLGIELEAKTSDIKVERIKLDLDEVGGTFSDSDLYRKIAQRIYVMSDSVVLGSMDLSNDTVIEDGADRFITISGLNYVVPKNTKRVLTIALDARSNWDSTFDADSWTVEVEVEGVRGVDGAGVNQYTPSTAFSNTFTTEGELADSATLTLSLNSSTPQDQSVIASSGSSENEKDGLELLRFDVRAEKDAVTITDAVVNLTRGGVLTTATATTGYLYDGSTLVDSATVVFVSTTAMTFTFDDIDYVVPKDTTRTLTVKVDIDTAGVGATTFVANVTAAGLTSENSNGTNIVESGSATGETITVRNVGPEFTLVSKSITRIPPAGFAGATSSLQADFVLRMKAVGTAIEFGDSASTTYALAGWPSAAAGSSFIVYLGGAASTPNVASSTSITVPSGVSASTGANSWILGEGNTIDIPISYIMQGRTITFAEITSGAYAIGLERLNWSSSVSGRQADTFMSGNSAWRTSTVTMP